MEDVREALYNSHTTSSRTLEKIVCWKPTHHVLQMSLKCATNSNLSYGTSICRHFENLATCSAAVIRIMTNLQSRTFNVRAP